MERVFTQWNDAAWLLNFFRDNFNDLVFYFKITKLDEAVYDTMEESKPGEIIEDGVGALYMVSLQTNYFFSVILF